MILTPNQLGILIYANGRWGPHSSKAAAIAFLDEAIAVAFAESGWNTNAHNSSGASGLYQILIPLHADKIPGQDMGKIFDPAVNVEVARKVYNEAGHSWGPWKSSNNSKRQQARGHGRAVWTYLHTHDPAQFHKQAAALSAAAAKDATASRIANETTDFAIIANREGIDGSQVGPDYGGISGAIRQVADTFDHIFSGLLGWFKDVGVTIGVFLLGVLLLILGVAFFIRKKM